MYHGSYASRFLYAYLIAAGASRDPLLNDEVLSNGTPNTTYSASL